MGIFEFIFGKKPEVNFTKEGRVTHNFTEKKWLDWKNRFVKNAEYDWKQHTGKKGSKKT